MRCQGYSTPLRWVNGVASRGRLAGASIPDASFVQPPTLPDPQQQQQHPQYAHSVAGSNPDMSIDSENSLSGPTPNKDPSSTESSSAFSPGSVIVPGSDSAERIFKRFMRNGLNRLYTTEASSWIKPFFEEMALQSPALVMIAGAIQGYMDDGMSVKSMEYVDLALQTFRQELDTRYEKFHVATVCAGLLVCSLCLLQAKQWTMYLDLMVNVYDLRNKLKTPGHIPIENLYHQHVLEVLGVMDLPSMVVGRANPPIGVWKLLRSLQDATQDGRVDGIEVVSGVPRSLLDIFAGVVDNDPEYTEGRFWDWPGDVGESLQVHYWESWRLAGIIEVRRRRRMERKARGLPYRDDDTPKKFPSTEVVMCRLIASMDALLKAYQEPRNQHLLVHNGLGYPAINAGLEVPLLKLHPNWKRTVDDVKRSFLTTESVDLIRVTFELLDAAWEDGTSTFDIEKLAQERNMEIGIF
ncbi:transcription factor [Fusarium longipes]|uniref:Transcription factor n=1 Tax=Fusarium longipes TaxID=694270 RepID=A0A395SAK3_9HYPO|nr:transcription factor [Fusarium longipes]